MTASDGTSSPDRELARRRAAGISASSAASFARSFASNSALRPIAGSAASPPPAGSPTPGRIENDAGPTAPTPVAVTSNVTFADCVLELNGMRTYSAPLLPPPAQNEVPVSGEITVPIAGVAASPDGQSAFVSGLVESLLHAAAPRNRATPAPAREIERRRNPAPQGGTPWEGAFRGGKLIVDPSASVIVPEEKMENPAVV